MDPHPLHNDDTDEDLSEEALRRAAKHWTRLLCAHSLWEVNRWMGVQILQWPTDLLVLQELLFTQRPEVVVETGSNRGGSAVFLASMLKLMGGGEVISVDISPLPDEAKAEVEGTGLADRIHFVTADSTRPETLAQVRTLLGERRNVLVILDSDHNRETVKKELDLYSQLVPLGGHLVVADTVTDELATLPGWERFEGDNPRLAVEAFLAETDNFVQEPRWEKFLVTFFPGGFLKRVK